MAAQVLAFGTVGLALGLALCRSPTSTGTCLQGCLLAPPQQRAGPMASFVVCRYLAFSVPAILVGLATGWFGLRATALGDGSVLLALTLLALAGLQGLSTRRR